MTFMKCWYHYTMHAPPEESSTNQYHQINMVIANCSKKDVIYPLTVKEIALAQERDLVLKKLTKTEKYSTHLVEDTEVLCKDGKMVTPKFLREEQFIGITTTCSTLDTHVMKRRYTQQCIGKV